MGFFVLLYIDNLLSYERNHVFTHSTECINIIFFLNFSINIDKC